MKSQTEMYLSLTKALVRSDPLHLTSTKSLQRDIKTLESRYLSEGLSFLTKTLPKLGKALDQGLAETTFYRPREFKSSSGNDCRPAFLQAYFKVVFDECGNLLENADPLAVKHLRQVLFFSYKLEVPYRPDQELKVIESFIQTEEGLELQVGGDVASMIKAASYITRTVFEEFNFKDICPRHGPGAVATGEQLEEKWEFSRLFNSIHQVYPYYEYFVVGGARELVDRLAWYRSLERLETGCAKVVLVPKDSRGPRLISAEPLEFQWIQQGLGRKLISHFESFWMTSGMINFTHQSVNRDHALQSSQTGEYATIDLKDASDRVSLKLVQSVFEQKPDLLRALEACRTSSTRLPDGRIIALKKFAPMGSALCFPVEAYIFWVVMVAAIARKHRMQPASVGRRIFVYGDDIVVPVDWVYDCMSALESVGLLVNRQKCCIRGPFRESCGMDAFKGICVTPLRLRKLWTAQKGDGSAYNSYVSLANSLSASGYKECSDLIWAALERTYGPIPYGTSISSFPCRIVDDPDTAEYYNSLRFRTRRSSKLQRLEFYVKRVCSSLRKTTLDGWTRLLKTQVSGAGDDPSRIVLPRSMKIKHGWAAVY